MPPGPLVGGADRGRAGPARASRRGGVAAQQHGMVVLDDGGEVITARDAVERREVRAAGAGPGRRARRPGPSGPRGPAACPRRRSPSPSCAGSPSTSRTTRARSRAVLLPHDWLTWRLPAAGRGAPAPSRSPTAGRLGHRLLLARGRTWLPDLAASARSAIPSSCRGSPARRGRRARRRRARRSPRAPATTWPRRLGLRPARRRRGGVDRHLGGRLRGDGRACRRPDRARRRLRRRDRAVPAAGLHAERGAGARRRPAAARRRPRRVPRWRWPPRRARTG